jgi:hypothetical protein
MYRWLWLGTISMLPSCFVEIQSAHDDETPSDSSDTSTLDTAGPCGSLGLPVRDFQDSKETPGLKRVAQDFTLTTREGEWTLSEAWSGCDSYLFIPSVPRQADGYPQALWSRDVRPFLKELPDNVHVFFISNLDARPDVNAELDVLKATIDEKLERLGEDAVEHWTPRIHYASKGLPNLNHWVGDYLRNPGWGFAIDRFQRIRDIGSFANHERYNEEIGWFEADLSQATNEVIYYNFEADRQDSMDAMDATVLRSFDHQWVDDSGWSGRKGYATLELPDAATMASFDTLELDATTGCGGEAEYGTCPAWDRIVNLYVCDEPVEPNAHKLETCQPYVAGTKEVEAIPADTLACVCTQPDGNTEEETQSCNSEGTGYDDCPCDCDFEAGRWITTYHREGRWVHDASYVLPWVRSGGSKRLAFYTIDPWEITVDMRLSNQGKGGQPIATWPLFTGGTFNAEYNDKYEPLNYEIPSDASRVELSVIVSGHGMESPGNCAEFCNTDHHFYVNGVDHLVDFPYISEETRCQEMVGEGTVPNQYGTWFYARSNWCPGKEVTPIVFDITESVTPGQAATFDYEGFFNGAPYTGSASISLTSWVTVWTP